MKAPKIRIGINGFGRIGRIATRIILRHKNLILAAINSRAEISSHAYLLKYDSTYGILRDRISIGQDHVKVNNQKVTIFNCDDPSSIPWERAKVDIVLDCTGKFRSSADLSGHLQHKVKYVILSAPAKDSTKTLVFGVNEDSFDPINDRIVSNSSCTTNCLATTLKVLHEKFIVKRGFMTTIHAVTDGQNLLDNSHKKEIRLRRAAFASIIPASTGSAKDIGKLFPELNGKIICQSLRIPLFTVSLINLTVETEKKTSKDDINKAFIQFAHNKLHGIIDVAKEELVSKDFTGNSHSSIIDPYLTNVVEDKLVSISAWYDNEWGYTSRLIDLANYIGGKI
ncbi:type I glyceraldehyde-3-phosphate dehydrogenase [Candidatus Gottesmanbacteria bacterium]|nr:type I glyceraldehyde-3-phosphate dehydrogenase [Candidatus Gottesmanbacteria bacterium]